MVIQDTHARADADHSTVRAVVAGNTMLQARNSSSSGGLNSAPDSPLLLRMHVSQSVPGALWGDFTRLQQVTETLDK